MWIYDTCFTIYIPCKDQGISILAVSTGGAKVQGSFVIRLSYEINFIIKSYLDISIVNVNTASNHFQLLFKVLIWEFISHVGALIRLTRANLITSVPCQLVL
jgi:hypothetical protein